MAYGPGEKYREPTNIAGLPRRAGGLGGLGLVVGMAVLVGACSSEAPEQTLDVAVAVPFAGTGLMAEAEQAWRIVVDDVNAHGGVRGKTLRVHERDTPLADAADLSPVAEGFVDLADEGYKYIISLISGAAVAPIVDAAVPRGVLAMSITSEEAAEDLPSHDGMLLRGILSTQRVIEIQAESLQAAGLRSLVIVGETRGGVPDPRQIAMSRAFSACGACSVVAVTYPAEADLYLYDWRSLGDQVNASQPEVIFLASANPSALLDVIHSIDRGGYSGTYHFAYGALLGPVGDALAGSEIVGRFRSHDLALPPSAHLQRFLSAYEERYGDPFVPEPRLIAFADYLSLLSLAVTRVGDSDPHRVALAMKEIAGPPGEPYAALDYPDAVRALAEGRDIDFAGLSGSLDFDERGEVSDGFVQEYWVTPEGEVAPVP